MRMQDERDTPTLGTGVCTTIIIIAGFFALASGVVNIMFHRFYRTLTLEPAQIGHNYYQFRVTLYLLLVLVILYVPWIYRVGRGLTSAATGGGFVIAASALSLRSACDLAVAFAWHAAWDLGPEALKLAETRTALSRNAGIVAFVLGLGLVAAALLGERKRQRP